MDTTETKRVAMRFLDHMERVGSETFVDPDIVTDDFLWSMPNGSQFSGPAMVEVAKSVADKFGGPGTGVVTGITAEDDRVAIEYETDRPLANGERYQNKYHFLFIVRDGRVSVGKEYLDTAHAISILFPSGVTTGNSVSA